MDSERQRARLLEENVIMAEALEAIIATRPRLVNALWGRKRCADWPNCNHACGEGLRRSHAIAESALRDTLGDAWAEKVKAQVEELVKMDEQSEQGEA